MVLYEGGIVSHTSQPITFECDSSELTLSLQDPPAGYKWRYIIDGIQPRLDLDDFILSLPCTSLMDNQYYIYHGCPSSCTLHSDLLITRDATGMHIIVTNTAYYKNEISFTFWIGV